MGFVDPMSACVLVQQVEPDIPCVHTTSIYLPMFHASQRQTEMACSSNTARHKARAGAGAINAKSFAQHGDCCLFAGLMLGFWRSEIKA